MHLVCFSKLLKRIIKGLITLQRVPPKGFLIFSKNHFLPQKCLRMKSKRFEKNYIYSERLLSTTSEGSLTIFDKGGLLRGLTDSGQAMLFEPVNLLCRID